MGMKLYTPHPYVKEQPCEGAEGPTSLVCLT
jgi:hypothetical protein